MNHKTAKPQNQDTDGAYYFRKVKLWQEAQGVAADIMLLADALPNRPAVSTVTRQLVGSAGSVRANIAEGHGRFSFATYKNHLSIAKASACESDSWLDLLRRTGYISPGQENGLHVRISALVALLTHKIRQLEAQERSKRAAQLRDQPAEYVVQEMDEVSGSGTEV